jgi:hypothetical protein
LNAIERGWVKRCGLQFGQFGCAFLGQFLDGPGGDSFCYGFRRNLPYHARFRLVGDLPWS